MSKHEHKPVNRTTHPDPSAAGCCAHPKRLRTQSHPHQRCGIHLHPGGSNHSSPGDPDMAETLIARMTLQAMPTNTPLPSPTPTIPPQPTPAPTVAPTVVYIPPAPRSRPHRNLVPEGHACIRCHHPRRHQAQPWRIIYENLALQKRRHLRLTTEFDVIFVSGDQLSAPAVLDFPAAVPVGGTIDISVSMTAPRKQARTPAAGLLPVRRQIRDRRDGKGYFQVKIVVE